MKVSPVVKRIGNFLLYSRPSEGAVPFLEQISIIAMYTTAASLLCVPLINYHLVFTRGVPAVLILLVGYMVLAIAGLAAFWITRTLPATRVLFGIAIGFLVIEQAIDAGGVYGLGVFYFLFAFPIVYMFFGLRFSVISMLAYCASFAVRLYFGAPTAESIYNAADVGARTLTVIGFAAAVEIVICACFDRIFKHLSRQAFNDPVCALPNRVKIEETVKRDMAYYRGARFEFSVIAIKMLNLNRVNTLLGTDGCDAILRETGERLKRFGMKTRIVGRWSSSIFVLLSDLHDSREVELFASSLLESLSEPYATGGRAITVSFALAVSRHPEDAAGGNTIIDNAISLLDSSAAQTGEIRFFSEETLTLQRYRYSILNNLSKADFDRSFRLVYQPKIRINDRKCKGAEALLRWHDDQFGDVSPAVFIPMAEQTGLIRKITRWVIRRCVADIARIRAESGDLADDLSFSVNLSVVDLRDKGLVDFLAREVLSVPGMDRAIEFEITEGIMLDEDAQVKRNLSHLQNAGFRIAIDDFGTGYSSLSYLHKIRVNELKIDQSFIRNLFARDTPDETPVIDAIISMSKSLGLAITAEGVENEAQVAWLESNGCDTVQGFLFSRGVSVGEFVEYLRKNRDGAARPQRKRLSLIKE
jgi:EAL domain-containing protein (putative c-di-GMP-specific phosphodiesterase class I)/GGDEF domain-containing protein